MKITAQQQNVIVSAGLPESTKFRIKSSAKAFQILSSSLYPDPVKAIIRELGTNAADSHIAAGKREVPFSVQLPSTLAPEFVIRDFGTGISPDRVMTVYRTY